MSRTSTGNRPAKPPQQHKAVLGHLRSMKRVLAALVPTWDVRAHLDEVVREVEHTGNDVHLVGPMWGQPRPDRPYVWTERVTETRRRRPDEYPQAESANWDALWKAAIHLRDMADRLAVHAQQQGRLAREAAHPANREPGGWDQYGD